MKGFVQLFALLSLLLLASASASATQITVASTTISGWSHPDTAPVLRIWINKPVVTSDSHVLQTGSPTTGVVYKAITCSVSGGVLTIPQVTIDSLNDALTGADAKYSAWFYSSKGQQIVQYFGFASFTVPSQPTASTWALLLQFNATAVPHIDGLVSGNTELIVGRQTFVIHRNRTGSDRPVPRKKKSRLNRSKAVLRRYRFRQ